MSEKVENPNLRSELGFGMYRNKRISDFDNSECDYLLWALKTVRIPKLLWKAIIEYLDTKVVINTSIVIGDKKAMTQDELIELEDFKDKIKLDFSQFLKPRIEPDNLYRCNHCNELVFGYPDKGYISDVIRCNRCHNVIEMESSELRFYFGWYKGWRVSDFKMKIDKEYLEWVYENIESLTPIFKGVIKKQIVITQQG